MHDCIMGHPPVHVVGTQGLKFSDSMPDFRHRAILNSYKIEFTLNNSDCRHFLLVNLSGSQIFVAVFLGYPIL